MQMAMQEFVDGVLEFVFQEVGSGIDRRIEIKKIKTIHMPGLIPFSTTQQGISIETAVRI